MCILSPFASLWLLCCSPFSKPSQCLPCINHLRVYGQIVQSANQTGASPASPYLGAFRGQLLLLHALHCQIVPLACCLCLLLHIVLLLPPLLRDILPPG